MRDYLHFRYICGIQRRKAMKLLQNKDKMAMTVYNSKFGYTKFIIDIFLYVFKIPQKVSFNIKH